MVSENGIKWLKYTIYNSRIMSEVLSNFYNIMVKSLPEFEKLLIVIINSVKKIAFV